jgi:xylulokinase
MCAAADVSPAVFPEPLPAGYALGTITAGAAAQTGLPPHAQVATGGHDHVCAALAAGAFRPDIVLDSTGTTEALLATVEHPHLDERTRRLELCCGCHVAAGRFYLLGGVLGVGPLVDRLAAVIAPGLPIAEAREHLTAQAQASQPGARGLWLLPFLAGAGSPERDPAATAAIMGLREHHTLADVARAAFEGLCYEMRALLEAMVAGANIPAPTLRTVGGGAANEFWLQLKANVTGRVVERAIAREGGALGAALLAGIGAGLFADAEAAYACVATPPARYEPDMGAHAEYGRRYRSGYLPLSRVARRPDRLL